jgi:hypothetical protein
MNEVYFYNYHDDDYVDGLDETTSLTCSYNEPIVHPYVMSVENHGGMITTGESPDSSTRTLWLCYQQSHQEANHEKLAKKIMNLAVRIILVHTSKGSLTCCKILRYRAGGLFPQKEGML